MDNTNKDEDASITSNEPFSIQETIFSSPDVDQPLLTRPDIAYTNNQNKVAETGFEIRNRKLPTTISAATQTPRVDDPSPKNNIPPSGGDSDYDSSSSVESDYYYDDQGKAHTYFRRKRRFGNESLNFPMQSIAINDGEVEGVTKSKSLSQLTSVFGKPLESASGANGILRRNNSTKRKVLHPVDNGSIYLAPPTLPTNESKTINGSVSRQPGRVEQAVPPSATNASIINLPENLRGLGQNIKKLSTEELLHISAIVSRKANREIYSVLQYSGEAWYLPEIRRVRPGEKEWQFAYIWGTGLVIAIAGRRLRLRLLSYTLRISMMALIWFVVWASTIPKSWSYRVGYFLDPYVTVLISAIVGGLVCRLLHIPPLLGVLWMGIIWNNIPHVGYFTSGILPQVRTIATRSGLSIILIRAGFSINLKSVRPIVGNCLLAASAYIIEMIVHTLMAQYYLEYNDWKWSFCQGLLGAIPSAAILVPGILLLQADGYSRSSGPLPLMLATMGLEAPVGIWAVNFVFGLISSDKEIGFAAGMGPVQIVGGAVVGGIAGAACHLAVWLFRNEAERLPGTGTYTEAHLSYVKWMAVIIIILVGHGLLFLGYEIEMAGGGVVAVTTLGFCISHSWTLIDDEWVEIKRNVGLGLASVWDLAAMPYLFSLVGAKINLSKIFNKTMFPKALLILLVTSAARVLYVILVPSVGLGFTWSEKVFHGIGSGFSKATVQSAMAGTPLDYVTKQLAATSTNSTHYEMLQHQLEMATMFQTTIVVFVLVGVPIASIWMTRVGPVVLKRE